MARTDGIKQRLDKMNPGQKMEVTIRLVKDPVAAEKELTEQERKAFTCYGQKLMDMQFRTDIKEFATDLNDKEYQDKINKQYENECKVDELKNYKYREPLYQGLNLLAT